MSTDNVLVDMDEKTLLRFISLAYQFTGITLATSKKNMLQGRLRPRMRELRLTSYTAYLQYLESNLPSEKQLYVDMVTTNETYFYRTPRIWEYLEKDYIPQWIAKNPGKVFNAWSAAASSGEEAYTLGCHLESFKEKYPSFQYQITGTDISTDILSFAEKGLYMGRAIDTFKEKKPELFKKYMRSADGISFSVTPEIRAKIKFQHHNLFESLKMAITFDLVLCRNVLIYFEGPDQEKVLKHISCKMKPEADLIIGESESLTRLQTPFTYKMPLIYGLTAAMNSLPKKDAA